jgi:hypothetical protein
MSGGMRQDLLHSPCEGWRGSMRGEIVYDYQKLNSEDQKAFRRFLWTNAVVGAILVAGLIVLASKVPVASQRLLLRILQRVRKPNCL